MVPKDKFIKYLNRVCPGTAAPCQRMGQLLEKNRELMENQILEKVVQSELDIPHALLATNGSTEPSIRENAFGKWDSLRNWFVDH